MYTGVILVVGGLCKAHAVAQDYSWSGSTRFAWSLGPASGPAVVEGVDFCALAPDATGSVYVNNLHALPDRKGRGTGTALLEATMRWARAAGASAMHLKVLETNGAAIGFYESRGWRRVGREQDTWAGEPIVALLYAIDLT